MVSEIINNQYPHYLYRRATESEAVQDANGSWQTTGGAWIFHSRCREETNGKGSQIRTASGKFLTFASLLQLPRGTQYIPEGVEVIATDTELTPEQLSQDTAPDSAEGTVRISGECLKFDKGRLHARLWV